MGLKQNFLLIHLKISHMHMQDSCFLSTYYARGINSTSPVGTPVTKVSGTQRRKCEGHKGKYCGVSVLVITMARLEAEPAPMVNPTSIIQQASGFCSKRKLFTTQMPLKRTYFWLPKASVSENSKCRLWCYFSSSTSFTVVINAYVAPSLTS